MNDKLNKKTVAKTKSKSKKKQSKKAHPKKKYGPRHKICLGLILLFIVTILAGGINMYLKKWKREYTEYGGDRAEALRPDIDVDLLTVNEFSRPGIAAERIKGVVVHYTANPGSTAKQNRDYFERLKDTRETQVSSNFVIGLDGEIIQCVPTWEVAYASNERNIDTVSIECCHPDESGAFTKKTYRSLVKLCGWLCLKFDLNAEDIIRHYDVTGKNCPKYYVENEKEFLKLRQDVQAELEKLRGQL